MHKPQPTTLGIRMWDRKPVSRAEAVHLFQGSSPCSSPHGWPPALLFGFQGSEAERDTWGACGILLGLGASWPTGTSISSNNYIGIASRVPSKDMFCFVLFFQTSLLSGKPKAMASSQASNSPSPDTIFHEGSFLPWVTKPTNNSMHSTSVRLPGGTENVNKR